MDVEVKDAFVPSRRAEDFGPVVNGTSPGSSLHRASIYRIPLFCALSAVATAPAVGMALGAVDEYAERASTRVLSYSLSKQSERASAHRRLGQASAQAHSAQVLLRETVEGVMGAVRDGRTLDLEQRVIVRRDCAYAVSVCKAAVNHVVEASGAGAQFEQSPLQRFSRDLQTLSTHVVYDTDDTYELFGRVKLGLPAASVMY